MSLSKAIRLTRMRIKDGHRVVLHLETRTGKQFTFPVANCSITGLAVFVESVNDIAEEIRDDDILPAAKLQFDDSEFTLGRLVVKRLPTDQTKVNQTMAFATIDAKVPVDGSLSMHLETDFDKGGSAYDQELGSDQFSLASFIGIDFNNIDIMERTKKFKFFYQDWKRSEKFGYFMSRDSSQGPRVKLTRRRTNNRNDYLMMGSNDYLGLASRPELKEAAIGAIKEYGFGSTGTPHTSGYSVLQDQLAKKMADLFGREDCIIYPSGYAANVGIVTGLCREQDLIVADMLAHASIHDGVTMSRATCRLFKHNDMEHLEKVLEENRSKYAGCLVITEGAFSMDGTVGKLDKVHAIARKYNARVMIDQAHCVGVIGQTGLGTVEKYGLMQETDVIMGLFSKALGSVGGFVVGNTDFIDWLRFYSRAYMFATTTPPSTAAATMKALDIMQSEDLVVKLQSNIKHFVTNLNQLGAPIDPLHETAIIPLEIRNEAKMGKMFQSLLNDGIFTIPIVYPVVSRTRCRFRFSVRADLTIGDLDFAASAIERAMKKADFSFEQIRDDKANKVA